MPINGISNQNAYWQSANTAASAGGNTNSTFAAALETFKTLVQEAQAQPQSRAPSSGASGSALSPQLQALENAALGKSQGGNNFSFNVSDSDAVTGSSGSGSTATGDQLSGSFQSESLIAVGTMTPDGKLDPFSSTQIQSEMAMVDNMGQMSFADSLQSFLALAQAGSPAGTIAAASYTDQQRFVGDNGLVSAAFNTSFTLQPAGDSAQPARTQPVPTPGSTLSTTA